MSGTWISQLAKNAIGVFALATSIGAQGAILNFSGSFSAGDPLPAGGSSTAVPSTLNGTWSFTFDDSALTGTGAESFDNLSLTSLTLNPKTIGSTSFSVANSIAFLGFLNGSLTELEVGGNPDGGISIGTGTNDWLAKYTISGLTANLTDVYAVVVGDDSLSYYRQINGTGSVSIPEPATLALLGLGLAGIPFVRRRRTPA